MRLISDSSLGTSKTAEDVIDALFEFCQCLSCLLHAIPPLFSVYRSVALEAPAFGQMVR